VSREIDVTLIRAAQRDVPKSFFSVAAFVLSAGTRLCFTHNFGAHARLPAPSWIEQHPLIIRTTGEQTK
jgi:hypothetical protein